MQLLILEDDPTIRETLSWNLQDKEINHCLFSDINELETNLSDFNPQLPLIFVLDIKIGSKESLFLIPKIKKISRRWGICVITALQSDIYLEKSFLMGIDHFFKKPFAIKELILNLEALWKRLNQIPLQSSNTHQLQNLKFFWEEQKIITPIQTYTLSLREMKTFKLLVDNPETPVSREILLNCLDHNDLNMNPRTIDNYMVKFRKILSEGSTLEISSLRGKGYQLQNSK